MELTGCILVDSSLAGVVGIQKDSEGSRWARYRDLQNWSYTTWFVPSFPNSQLGFS